MHKTLSVIGTILIIILFTLVACESTPTPPPSPAPAPTPEFEIISLDVMPPEVTVGETAEIKTIVKNVGSNAGTYAVVLSVDGVTAEVKETALITPGSSTVVAFSLVKDAPGTYEIVIGKLSSSLTITPAPPEFEVISLDIEPAETVAGETVSITAEAKNIGGTEGTYAAILTVDGATVETKEVAITPGSSKVATFSLTEDTPGTYAINIGELSSSLVVKEKLVAKKIELKYDDGESEGFISQGPGWGYSVHFSPPAIPFTISKVKVLAGLYGTEYADKEALLEIWDEDFDVIYSREMPATEFSDVTQWVTLETDITVEGDFRVVFFTNSQETGGIFMGYYLGETNEGSEAARAGGSIVDWIESWETGDHPQPRETTNWMIRVTGTYMASPEPPTPTPTPTPKEVELKYDDGMPDGSMAIGRTSGRGHLVQFSPPSIPLTMTKVKIFGQLYGSGYEALTFVVQVWDSELKEIYSASYPHTEFSASPGWVEIDVPEVVISGDFYIHVYTHTPREGGIQIFYDSSVQNEHSEVTQNWEVADWYVQIPKEQVNWMIRVTGTYMAPPD